MRAAQPNRARALSHNFGQHASGVDFLEYTVTSSSATISRTIDPLFLGDEEELSGDVSVQTRNGVTTLPRVPAEVVPFEQFSSRRRQSKVQPTRPDVPVRTGTRRKTGEIVINKLCC